MAKNTIKKLARRVAPGNVETRHGNRAVRAGQPVARQRLARGRFGRTGYLSGKR